MFNSTWLFVSSGSIVALNVSQGTFIVLSFTFSAASAPITTSIFPLGLNPEPSIPRVLPSVSTYTPKSVNIAPLTGPFKSGDTRRASWTTPSTSALSVPLTGFSSTPPTGSFVGS